MSLSGKATAPGGSSGRKSMPDVMGRSGPSRLHFPLHNSMLPPTFSQSINPSLLRSYLRPFPVHISFCPFLTHVLWSLKSCVKEYNKPPQLVRHGRHVSVCAWNRQKLLLYWCLADILTRTLVMRWKGQHLVVSWEPSWEHGPPAAKRLCATSSSGFQQRRQRPSRITVMSSPPSMRTNKPGTNK